MAWPLLPVLLLMGCVAGGKAPIVINQYIMEYPPPVFEGLTPLDDIVGVGRFAVAQSFNTPMMVCRTKAYEHDVDYYNRWRVNPGDMVTDYLLRDLKRSGLFKAVFSYRDTEDARYSIQGMVEDFLETREQDANRAVMTVSITLLDTTQKEINRKVVFQKRYHHVQPLQDGSAPAFARGMSQAMGIISQNVIRDIYTHASRSKP